MRPLAVLALLAGALMLYASTLLTRRPHVPAAAAASLPLQLATPPPPPLAAVHWPRCGDGLCEPPETIESCFVDCPGVTTAPMCGEEPHSDRGGRTMAFGVGHRAKSAQDCCDKCRARQNCNSWTFCGLPVCFGLDTGWNHTFGECWLRRLEDPAKPTFGQRGSYSLEYRTKMVHTRKACTSVDDAGGLSLIHI